MSKAEKLKDYIAPQRRSRSYYLNCKDRLRRNLAVGTRVYNLRCFTRPFSLPQAVKGRARETIHMTQSLSLEKDCTLRNWEKNVGEIIVVSASSSG